MTTNSKKPVKPIPSSGPGGIAPPQPSKSPAQLLQAHTELPPQGSEQLAVTLRTDTTFEYHVTLARSAVEGILDPDVPDVFIEVPSKIAGIRRFLHTAYIKEVDVRGM